MTTTHKEPASATLLAARIMRAYPTLSPYSAATLAEELCRIERAQRRHAERCCSGEDGGYTKVVHGSGRHYGVPIARNGVVHDPEAEQRAGVKVERQLGAWVSLLATRISASLCIEDDNERDAKELEIVREVVVELEADPRGAVLKVRFPGEPEAVWS